MTKYLNRPAAIAIAIAIVGLLAYYLKNSSQYDSAPPPAGPRSRVVFLPFGISPTDAKQQEELDKLETKYHEKIWRYREELLNVLTPDQRNAQREAAQAAYKEGKRGQEVGNAANKAAGISEEQIAKLNTVRTELETLSSQLRSEINALLTASQKKEIEEKIKLSQLRNQPSPQAPPSKATGASKDLKKAKTQ